MGVISCDDVATLVADAHSVESCMLEARIRDWRVEEAEETQGE